jgi:acyl transferase domain-containing protein
LVVSANDSHSLKENIRKLSSHLINPRVSVNLEDLAATLSERRTRLWHRAFVTTRTTLIDENDFVVGKNSGQPSKIGFVFTGQGAQWAQMGKELLEFFPWTRSVLEELDQALAAQEDPPKWSLISELTEPRTAEHLRQPEFSQPLVTALQLCILAVLESWGIKPSSVVGHSSGEIAAAYTAGYLDRAGAIKAAFYRGRAAVNCKEKAETDVGMIAVGLGPEAALEYIEKYAGKAWIACFNSPNSVTVSGKKSTLEALGEDIKADGQFARALQVDLAYHSELMGPIGVEYDKLLNDDGEFRPLNGSQTVRMFSSVTGALKEGTTDATYWKTNMVSPVRFAEGLTELVKQDSPTVLIEIGPSGALAGPVSQILKSLTTGGDIVYCSAWARGANAGKSLFDVAGRLFMVGAPIDLAAVNGYDQNAVKTIIDLPNYSWNHTVKYWHENAASRDWRFKQFITHDLLGSKIPGTAWESPTWRKHLKLDDVPWLRDHKMGPDVLIPGAGLATMALEAMYQKFCALNPEQAVSSPNELAYRFRNAKFDRAVVVEENKPTTILLTLTTVPGGKDWHEYRIRTTADGVVYEHCSGLIRVQDPIGDEEALKGDDLAPLRHPQSAKLWYKAQREVGMGFGETFQTIKSIESVSGSRTCRTIVSLEPPPSKWNPQSYYPFHPAILDGCLQTATPANAAGERSLVKDTMIPALVDDMIINKIPKDLVEGLSVAESIYTGRGRQDVAKSWIANISIHHPVTGALLLRVKGLNYIRLDVDEKPDPHVFSAANWKPDISLLTQDQLTFLSPFDPASTKVATVIDLIAAKKPLLKVLEINTDEADTSVVWFQGGDESTRAAYTLYHFGSPNANSLLSGKTAYESKRNTAFHLLNFAVEGLGLPVTEPTYDLVIVKASLMRNLVDQVIKNIKPLLKQSAFTLLVSTRNNTINSNDSPALEAPGVTFDTLSEGSSSAGIRTPPDDSLATSVESLVAKDSAFGSLESRKLKANLGFSSVLEIGIANDEESAYLCHNVVDQPTSPAQRLIIARFHEGSPDLKPALHGLLESSEWTIENSAIVKLATEMNKDPNAVVLVVDELFMPVLKDVSEQHWDALKTVISTGNPILWITKGGQTSQVTEPDSALVHGLFRVVRREDPQARLITLDVQSATSPATGHAIAQILHRIRTVKDIETEYAERDGILYLQRVKPDGVINTFKAAEGRKGLEPVVKSLHKNPAQVRLQAEKVGTLQSLTWCETAVGEVPMEPGMVEIEVRAVGVNFKVSKKISAE